VFGGVGAVIFLFFLYMLSGGSQIAFESKGKHHLNRIEEKFENVKFGLKIIPSANIYKHLIVLDKDSKHENTY